MAQSGQKTVTTAGTAEALGSQQVAGPILIKALTTNTDLVYVGNSAGVVTSSTGYPLAAGDQVFLEFISDLGSLFVNSAVNGEVVAWILLQ